MKEHDIFRSENTYKALMHFAIPGIITIFMAELYNMVDTMFVGQYVGPSAIGAMSIAFPVQRMIIALSLLIGVGTATKVSRVLGEKNKEALSLSIRTSVFMGIIILGLLPIVMYIFPDFILYKLGARTDILEMSKDYLLIVVLGTFFLGFTNIFGYELTALGNPKVTLVATTVGTITNVVVDYVLVGIFSMGVEGAAIATVSSQGLAFIYTMFKFKRYNVGAEISIGPKFDMKIFWEIFTVGFATFIVEISDAVLIAALNNVLLPIGGNKAIIIVGVITRISMLMYITIIGISSGMQPLAAYNHGAGDYGKIKKVVRATVITVFSSSVVIWSFALMFSDNIVSAFMKESELLYETSSIFRLTIIIFPLISIYYVCIYLCQALGMARLGFILSIYRQILLFIPILIVMTNIMGMKGAWLTYPITDGIAAVTGAYFLVKLAYKPVLYKKL